MKQNLVLGVALAVMASPAMATKARLVALGEDITGSLYFKDSRNVFLNAAQVNDYKNTVVLEWGADGAGYNPGATPPTTAKLDTDNNNQGEGGVFVGHGSMVYGVYLGAESFQTNDARRYLNFQDRRVHQDNQIDVFVGGDAGLKWGANVTYSKNEDDTIDAKSDSGSLRLGVMDSRWEAFANISFLNKFEGDINSSGVDEEFKGKLGYEIGGNYDVGHGKVFAFWRHAAWEQESDNSVSATPAAANGGAYLGEADVSTDKYIVGWGNQEKVGDKTTLFWKASYVMNKRKLETQTNGDATLDDSAVPVTVGLEYDSNEWLTLRGSVTHNVWGKMDNDYDTGLAALVSPLVTGQFGDGKKSLPNSTNVNGGATVHFGDFSIDGLLGLGTGQSTTETGILATNNLMSRVAMMYKW